ncbi:MAG: YdcF family protein [Mangrovicoccus sp.]
MTATALILLGASVDPNGEPSPALARRIRQAAKIWRQGGCGFVITSGGFNTACQASEAEVMQRELVALGVPQSKIYLEARSRSTWENAEFAVPLAQRLGASQAVLVTDGYHMRRALMVFRAKGLPCSGAAVPWPRGRPLGWIKAVLREALARRAYGARLKAQALAPSNR